MGAFTVGMRFFSPSIQALSGGLKASGGNPGEVAGEAEAVGYVAAKSMQRTSPDLAPLFDVLLFKVPPLFH